jgi:hypothetical protein
MMEGMLNIFDPRIEDEDPRMAARRNQIGADSMLAFAGPLLAAAGQSTQPISIGQAIGAGMAAAQKSRQAGLQQSMQQSMFDAKMEDIKLARAKQEKQDKYIETATAGMTDPSKIALAQAFPGKFAAQQFAKPQQRKIIQDAAGFNRYADTGDRVFPGVQAKPPQDPSAMREIVAIQQRIAKLPEGHPNKMIWQARLDKLVKHPPGATATVNMDKGLTEEQKLMGKNRATMYQNAIDGVAGARRTLDSVALFRSGTGGFDTGAFGRERAALSAVATFAGVDPKTLGLGDTASAQAITTAGNQMALAYRTMGGTNAMPGPMSDRDVKFLVESVASIGKDPRVNDLLLSMMERASHRAIEYERAMTNWISDPTNKESLRGFRKHWNDTHGDLVTDEDRAIMAGVKKASAGSSVGKPGERTGSDPLGILGPKL